MLVDMRVPLRFREERPRWPEIGDCWYSPHLDEIASRFLATTRAQRGRDPITVCLSIVGKYRLTFDVDSLCLVDGKVGSSGWAVTGDIRPLITLRVEPSILLGTPGDPHYWHGYVRDGVVEKLLE